MFFFLCHLLIFTFKLTATTSSENLKGSLPIHAERDFHSTAGHRRGKRNYHTLNILLVMVICKELKAKSGPSNDDDNGSIDFIILIIIIIIMSRPIKATESFMYKSFSRPFSIFPCYSSFSN